MSIVYTRAENKSDAEKKEKKETYMYKIENGNFQLYKTNGGNGANNTLERTVTTNVVKADMYDNIIAVVKKDAKLYLYSPNGNQIRFITEGAENVKIEGDRLQVVKKDGTYIYMFNGTFVRKL